MPKVTKPARVVVWLGPRATLGLARSRSPRGWEDTETSTTEKSKETDREEGTRAWFLAHPPKPFGAGFGGKIACGVGAALSAWRCPGESRGRDAVGACSRGEGFLDSGESFGNFSLWDWFALCQTTFPTTVRAKPVQLEVRGGRPACFCGDAGKVSFSRNGPSLGHAKTRYAYMALVKGFVPQKAMSFFQVVWTYHTWRTPRERAAIPGIKGERSWEGWNQAHSCWACNA